MRVNAIARLEPRNLQLARWTVGVGWRAALTAPSSCGACLGYGGYGGTAKETDRPPMPFPLHLRTELRTTFWCGRSSYGGSVARHRENRTEIFIRSLCGVAGIARAPCRGTSYRKCESSFFWD